MPKFISYANNKFWKCYYSLPKDIQEQADKAYSLFQENPEHPSLHFKKVGGKQPIYSARVTDAYRVLGLLKDNAVYWFWIGDHDSYDKLIS